MIVQSTALLLISAVKDNAYVPASTYLYRLSYGVSACDIGGMCSLQKYVL